MTDTLATADASSDHHDAHPHPTETAYWKIFAILAVITAAEVAWSYLGLEGPALVLPLIAMMLVKFVLVAGVFMHLYYDWKAGKGWMFALMFAFGLVLAVLVYFVVVAAFEFQI